MRLPPISIPSIIPRLLLLVLSIIGWALFLRMIVINVAATMALSGEPIQGLGIDTYAYWLAGAHLVSGETLYQAASIEELGAYLYPPPFAQAWIPVSMLPHAIADWGWRLLGVLSIRYMAGSWLVSGVWMLFPGTIVELTAGNVTFQVAALTVAGLRGRAEGVAPAALAKLSSIAVVPFLWLRRPASRRGLLVGAAVTAAVVGFSVVVNPGLWADYAAMIGAQAGATIQSTTIVHVLPTAGADYLLRIGVAAFIVIASVRLDSPRLAFLAAFVATPTLWVQRFAVLLALFTLEDDRWLRPFRWPWLKGAGTPPGRDPTALGVSAPSDSVPSR